METVQFEHDESTYLAIKHALDFRFQHQVMAWHIYQVDDITGDLWHVMVLASNKDGPIDSKDWTAEQAITKFKDLDGEVTDGVPCMGCGRTNGCDGTCQK